MIRILVAEALGCGLLALAALGSAQAAALAGLPTLPAVAAAAGLMLAVTITICAPVSGGHLNPAITLLFLARREITPGRALAYVAAQTAGGLAGGALVAAMGEAGQAIAVLPQGWALSEALATGGFVLIVAGALTSRPEAAALIAGAYGAAAVLGTVSGGMANPAVMLARAFSEGAGGLAPLTALALTGAQLAGAGLALAPALWLFRRPA